MADHRDQQLAELEAEVHEIRKKLRRTDRRALHVAVLVGTLVVAASHRRARERRLLSGGFCRL